MERNLSLGYSPCPNDTFIFHALISGRIHADPYRFDVLLADVEELNQRARRQALDITKISIHAILHLLDDYCLLHSGGAIGRGCGPLVVAREAMTMEDLRHKSIAIPGELTTAHLLLKLNGTHRGERRVMSFDRIMSAVAGGEVDAGVIIHEGRFTYPAMGLHLVLDLGNWWEAHTGLPIPLGGILVRRELGPETAGAVEDAIRRSLIHGRAHPEDAWSYIRSHAQEMEPAVIRQHIDMFVNDFSLNTGEEGDEAIRCLIEAARGVESLPPLSKGIFWDRS